MGLRPTEGDESWWGRHSACRQTFTGAERTRDELKSAAGSPASLRDARRGDALGRGF